MEVKKARPQASKPKTSPDTRVHVRKGPSVVHLWLSFWEGKQLLRVSNVGTRGRNPPGESYHNPNIPFQLSDPELEPVCKEEHCLKITRNKLFYGSFK